MTRLLANLWDLVDLDRVRAARQELVREGVAALARGDTVEADRLCDLVALSEEWEAIALAQLALPPEQRSRCVFVMDDEGGTEQ